MQLVHFVMHHAGHMKRRNSDTRVDAEGTKGATCRGAELNFRQPAYRKRSLDHVNAHIKTGTRIN
jgi:hypothetical protein